MSFSRKKVVKNAVASQRKRAPVKIKTKEEPMVPPAEMLAKVRKQASEAKTPAEIDVALDAVSAAAKAIDAAPDPLAGMGPNKVKRYLAAKAAAAQRAEKA